MARDSGPERRTTPSPARPGGVAIATMVSSVANTAAMAGGGARGDQRAGRRRLMITCFSCPSPWLSDATSSC